jgi:CRP-like cAMP-binding protein
MTRSEIARLRDEASQALKTLRPDQALVAYLELERIDPQTDWAKRAAAVYMMLGRSSEAVEALLRAERFYSMRTEMLKAAAICKHVLKIDPGNEEAKRRIGSMKADWDQARGTTSSGVPPAVPPVAGPAREASTQAILGRISPDSALERVPLREVIPGSVQVSGRASGSDGIYRIPLQEPEGDIQIDIQIEEPVDPLNASLVANPLFAELDNQSFTRLLTSARLVDLSAGEVLFRQGDEGDALYVIAEGRVGVIDEGPPRVGVAQLEDGDFFGEIALLTKQPRTATISALDDTKLIAIDRELVLELIAADTRFLTALLRFLRDRLAGKLMTTNPLFTALSERDQIALRSRFRFLEVDRGAVLLEEGKKPDGLLLLLTGRAEVVRMQSDQPLPLATLCSGDIAGELALLTDKPSVQTVRALEKCLVLELPAEAFLKIVHARPEAMAFVTRVIEERTAEAKAVLTGGGTYSEGRVRF